MMRVDVTYYMLNVLQIAYYPCTLDYLNLDPCSVSTVVLSLCGDLYSLLNEEKVKCFVEDVLRRRCCDVSASGPRRV